MILQSIIAKDDKTIEEKFNNLTSEQQIELLNEIQAQRDSFKESKIVAETQIKSLQDSKNKILETLKKDYNLDSIEAAEKKIAELNGEIVSALTEFSESQT